MSLLLLICMCMGFGSLRPRHCFIVEWLTPYSGCTPTAVLCSAEAEKKRKYSLVGQCCHASFTPLCVSVDGLLAPEARLFV